MRRFSFHVVAVLGAALAIAGCGGGDDDETPAPATPPAETTALTKEELLAQGDAICAEVNAAAGALASSESAGGPADTAELYTGMVQRLHALGAPSDDSTGYSDFSAAAEELGQAEGNLELAAQRGDPEGLADAETEASTALSSFQEAASDFGFEQCSEGPSAASAPDGDEPGGVETEEEVAPEEVEEAPEETEEVAPETGGAGSAEEGGAGGGAEAGGETGGGETGGSSGGIGPG